MSRSIHTTRRHLQELKRANFANRAERQQCVVDARQALARKHAIKRRSEWKLDRFRFAEAPVSVDSIPIEVYDQREFVQYPASVQDLRAVLRLLPRGTLDGVSRIMLCLGAAYAQDGEDVEDWWGEPDPLVGRLGTESLPGVYAGKYLGTYSWHDASICLYAYVYDAVRMPDRELRELYLRLQMLDTLAHEVAHHWEGSSPDRRGRWADRPEGKREWFARRRAYQWTQQLIIPYLERRYPMATQALVEWVERHGGVTLPLSKLINHLNEAIFYTGGAVDSLFEAVDRGESARDVRLGFAHDLHYAERYDDALRSLESILVEHPDDIEAQTLQADIYEHQERYEQAEHVARSVIIRAPTRPDAWDVLLDVYRAQGNWRELETAATRVIEVCEIEGYKTKLLRVRAHRERACARIELGDFAGASADLAELSNVHLRLEVEAVASLRALLLLRTGQYEEALRMAREGLKRQYGPLPWCGMLIGVRFEAAHRLGRPQEVGMVSMRAAKLMRRHGHGQWIHRLVRDCGLRIWSRNGV